MLEAAGTSGFADAAIAYSAGWRGQTAAGSVAATTTILAAAGSVAATTTILATAAAGAQQDADSIAQDSVAFSDTALQALATYADGGLTISIGLQATSTSATAGSSGHGSMSLALSLEIQSVQGADTATDPASLQGVSILVDGKNGSQLFGGIAPAGNSGALDQPLTVTEALAAATADANAGAFSIDVCYSSVDVGVSCTNDDLEIGVDAHGRLSVTAEHTSASDDYGELLAYQSGAQILPTRGNTTIVGAAPTHFFSLTGLDTVLGNEVMRGDMEGIPGLNNLAVLSNAPPALGAWRNNEAASNARAVPGGTLMLATNPGSQGEDARVALASLTAFAKARPAAMRALRGLLTKQAAVSAIA